MAATYAGASATAYMTNNTSISTPIPVAAATGETIIACVMHRSTLTPPAGWTLIASQGVLGTGGYTHSVSMYYKVSASDGGTNPSWSQSASNRMALQYHVYTGGGTPTVAGTAVDSGTPINSLTIPNNGAIAATSILVNASSFDLAATSGTETLSLSPLYRFQVITAETLSANRLLVAHAAAETGYNSWGDVSSGAVPNAITSVTAILTFANGVYIPPENIRATQAPVLTLVGEEATLKVSQMPALVLWGLASEVKSTQLVVQVFGRRIPRRTIGVID